jgi:hypothetical protein
MSHMKRLADQEVERLAQEEGLDITDDQVYQELWVRVCEKLQAKLSDWYEIGLTLLTHRK